MKRVPGAIVGAGTVTNPQQLDEAHRGGGRVHRLARADRAARPGGDRQRGAVPSRHRQRGRHHARARPGADALQVLPGDGGGRHPRAEGARRAVRRSAASAPPAGSPSATAPEWLALEPVLCVGGSWVVAEGPPDRAEIERLAREAAALGAVKTRRGPRRRGCRRCTCAPPRRRCSTRCSSSVARPVARDRGAAR